MRQRVQRVQSLLLKEIGQAIREEIQDPALGFVTLLHADVARDLKTARVYYTVMGTDEEKKASDLVINNASKQIKRIVNDRIKLRYAIDLNFIREDTIEEAFKIQKIIDQLENERKEKGFKDDEGDSTG